MQPIGGLFDRSSGSVTDRMANTGASLPGFVPVIGQ
jgi:hypothetical protein